MNYLIDGVYHADPRRFGSIDRPAERFLTVSRIGVPTNPYVSRSRFSRNLSYEKWNRVATFVNMTKVGGDTPVCAAYSTRTLR